MVYVEPEVVNPPKEQSVPQFNKKEIIEVVREAQKAGLLPSGGSGEGSGGVAGFVVDVRGRDSGENSVFGATTHLDDEKCPELINFIVNKLVTLVPGAEQPLVINAIEVPQVTLFLDNLGHPNEEQKGNEKGGEKGKDDAEYVVSLPLDRVVHYLPDGWVNVYFYNEAQINNSFFGITLYLQISIDKDGETISHSFQLDVWEQQ